MLSSSCNLSSAKAYLKEGRSRTQGAAPGVVIVAAPKFELPNPKSHANGFDVGFDVQCPEIANVSPRCCLGSGSQRQVLRSC